MNEMIEARVYEGEMWVRARDHSQAVGAAFEAGKAVGAAVERERIKAANAPEIERCNAHIKTLEDERAAMMQLFTDPENQPTQHGTVTVEYMQREIAAEREAMVALAAKQGWAMKNEDPFEDAVREIAAIRARGQA